MPVYLKALALRNYRGIGDALQKMPDFKTFNFFIGANNAGKSTVLNFISRHLPPEPPGHRGTSHQKGIDPLEPHGGPSAGSIYMALGYTADQALKGISVKYPEVFKDARYRDCLIKILSALGDDQGNLWIGSALPYQNELRFAASNPDRLEHLFAHRAWHELWHVLTKRSGGSIRDHWIPETVRTIEASLDQSIPEVRLIPAIRQISSGDVSIEDYSGAGLINRLAAIQNPEYNRRNDRMKFDRINGFLQAVTGRPTAAIEIPFSRSHILVHMDGRVLPLSSLGTGIHEVIMIAAFCTLSNNEIICVEEPELHLHPLLQRKLMRYLAVETQNQYFIATHSAAFIDTPDAAIFHVSLEENTTRIREAVLKKDRFAICVDLGHRASDIVQANAVVWVEGPSDRIYLKHWISLFDLNLIEGIHYSIMFYGGRLLSHLSADDEEISEFIQLRALNRHLAIVMDSDKAAPHARVNATKLRLRNEFELHGGVAWITKGREIENYIDHARLQRAVKSVYGDAYRSAQPGSPFDHPLHFQRNGLKRRRKGSLTSDLIERDVDKVKVSRAVVDDGVRDLDVLDLYDRVTQVIKMINRANT